MPSTGATGATRATARGNGFTPVARSPKAGSETSAGGSGSRWLVGFEVVGVWAALRRRAC